MLSAIAAWMRRVEAVSPRGTSMRVRAIRGAIDIEVDSRADVRRAVAVLITEIAARNALELDRIISAIFTTTPDIRSMFPAQAAREAGWGDVPLLCATEMMVPGSLPLCIRVLVHVELPAERVAEHVYLGVAASLRPDLALARRS